MGIPSFYRWVKERYPQCVVTAREDAVVEDVNGFWVPVDTMRPNPNGVEFDNLYLDLNGIIHPCFHPEGLPGPTSYDQVFDAVFRYIDRIFSIVRPRKLLFLAIDGVAPRAKMNQQRSRRFKAAKDAADNALKRGRHRMVLRSHKKKSEIQLDSNVITPGTEFMDLLSSALRYYIHLRMNEKIGWWGIKVILSDASVPGEGEHKIMSYIRLQRNMPGYDPNTRHCLYGLDADLIMLALATHEIHFSVLREDLNKSSLDKNASIISKKKKRWKKRRANEKSFAHYLEEYIMSLNFQFINIWILREYLAFDMKIPSSTMETNLERLIDDFVFMCLFVGNDFLPHIPSLEISEGAINLLMRIYTKEFVQRGGYLTNSFEVNLKHVEHFVQSIATHEQKILKKRAQIEKQSVFYSQVLSNSELGDDSSKLSFVERNTKSRNQESCLQCKIPPVSQDPQNIDKESVFCSQGLSNSELGNDAAKLSLVERNTESGNQESCLECKIPTVSQDPQNIEKESVFWSQSLSNRKLGDDSANLSLVERNTESGNKESCLEWKMPTVSRDPQNIEKESVFYSQGLSNSELGDDSAKLSLVERNTESGNQESCLECKIPTVSHDPQNIEKESMFCSQGLSNSELGDDSTKLLLVERNIESGSQESCLERNMEWGLKKSYYAEKFEVKLPDDRERIRRHAVLKYIEGICWVMHYYYEGVCSWQWFYPYHYAPFASDFYDINQLKFHFTLGEPLKPFDQLLGVLPPASAHALPLFYRNLMTDASSPISDFYPTDFELDMNGKRFSWQAICKLPFIEESRLLSEIEKVEHTLTDEERQRNSLGQDILFLHSSHPLALKITSFSKRMNDSPEFIEGQVEQKIDPQFSGGMNGYVYIPDKSMWPVEIPSPVKGMKVIAKNEVLFVFYKNPSFHSHIPRLLPEVNLPNKVPCMRRPISRYKFCSRSIIKLASGSNLAKLAHSLVSQNCLRKQPQTLQSMKLDNLVNPDGLKEMNPEVKRKRKKNKKRKWSEGDADHVGADAIVKMKTGEDKSGKRNVNNIMGKVESCIVRKQTEGRDELPGADGSKEIKEVKSRKRKRRSKNMNNSEIQGVSNNTVEKKMESCILEEKSKADDNHADRGRLEELNIKHDDVLHKIVETLVSSSSREYNQGNGDWVGANGLQEIKAEGGSRKKKLRSKKKLKKSDSKPTNIAEKLERCVFQEKSHAGEEIKIEGDSAPNNIVEKLDYSSFREQNQGDGDQATAHGLQEVKFEVGLKKKKCRPKRRKQNETESVPNNIFGKLESSFLEEKCKVDDHNAEQHTFEELKGKGDSVPHNIVEMLESCTPVQQSDGKGEHADGGESAGVNGLGELKVEGGGESVAVNRSGELKVEGGDESAGINGLGEFKIEVGFKKGKRRPKKKNKNKNESALNNISEKLETSILKERSETDDHNADKHKFKEIKVKEDSLPHNIVETLGSCTAGHQSDGKSEHADGCGGESTGITGLGELEVEVGGVSAGINGFGKLKVQGGGESVGVIGLEESKVEVGSRKNKHKRKKKKQDESESAPNNIVEKMESSFLQEKSKTDDHKADQHKFEELKAKEDSVARNIVERLESHTSGQLSDGEGEHAHGGGGESAGINGLGELKVEVESKRKRKRLKKRKISEGDDTSHNNVENLWSSSTQQQNQGNDQVDADGLQEMKAEVGPKKKKRRSKKRKSNTTDPAPINIFDKLESSHTEKMDGNGEHTVAVELKEVKQTNCQE